VASSLGDSRRNKELREASKNDLRIEKLIIETLMAHKEGRRWIWIQLAKCSMFTQVSQLNALDLAWKEGLRNVGLDLTQQVMSWAPKHYATMLVENSTAKIIEDEDDRRPAE
jgi:hypothetical protein